MGDRLIIRHRRSDGTTQEISFDRVEVMIGREPGSGGIVLDSPAVSRQHAALKQLRTCWLFFDCDSTNGSRVNGFKLPPYIPTVVRSGDKFELGDQVLEVDHVDPNPVRSAIIMKGSSIIDEFPVPEFGRACSVGGERGDVVYDSSGDNRAALIVEGRGPACVIFSQLPEVVCRIGARYLAVGETHQVVDREIVEVGGFHIVFNIPTVDHRPRAGTSTIRSWDGGDAPPAAHSPEAVNRSMSESARSVASVSGFGTLSGHDEVRLPSGMQVPAELPRFQDLQEPQEGGVTKIVIFGALLLGVGIALVIAAIVFR